VKNGSHCLSLPKQRNALLRMIPRGSKPTRSKRARTSSVNRKRAAEDDHVDARAARAAGVHEQRAGCACLGSDAGRRTSESEIAPPSLES
jgi:hypothetical protein